MIAWIFDVDGVLVHLEEHRLVEMGIIDEIIKRLAKEEPVALVSGRGTIWQRDNVISLIHQEFKKTSYPLSLLNNLYISGEFGGTAIAFADGKEIVSKDDSCLIPQELKGQATAIMQPFLDDFIIEPKETIFTVYAHSIERFNHHAEDITKKFTSLITSFGLDQDLELQKDAISINIRHKKANKRYSTKQVIKWLQEKHIIPQEFIAFGDSSSDMEIGEELAQQQFSFTFVFVGLPEKLAQQPSFPLTITKEKYDKGTLEFLQEFTD